MIIDQYPKDIPLSPVAAPFDNTQSGEILTVDWVKSSDKHTIVRGTGGIEVWLRPYIYLQPGNVLEFHPSIEKFQEVNKLSINPPDGVLHKVQIYPPYSKSGIVSVPPHKFMVTFRERTGRSDLRATKILEQFHYRGKGLNRIIGRRTVLIAEIHEYGIIGYGVLSATLGAAKPRFAIFKTNFTEQMRTKLINRLVRIPRVVIHPEFRGVGLGAMMAQHLVEYARNHWDVRDYTPIAVEVVASMTEYHRFFEAAGFVRAGNTSGYKEGILPRYGSGSWEERPKSRNYDFLENQKPKPYLIYPLESSVRGALMEQGLLSPKARKLAAKPRPRGNRITLQRLWVEYKSTNGLTPRAEEVKAAFDVDSRQLRSPVLRNLSLRIDPGDVVVITGASGSGKSTILKLLTTGPSVLEENMEIRGEVVGLVPASAAVLTSTWDNELPLVDQVGESTNESIEILNSVGLAEAHLYVKRPSQISDGQRYRFAIALLCDSKKPLWVADEFASSLDPLTAAIVAKGLRKRAWISGCTVVLSAPHIENFIDSLVPNKMVTLRWGGIANVASIRCRFRVLQDSFEVRIKNTGRVELTGVQVLGAKVNGERQQIVNIGAIPPLASLDLVKVPLERLGQFTSVVIYTNQKIGDVFYLRDRADAGRSL